MGTTTSPSEKRVLQTTNLRLAVYLIGEGCQPKLVRAGVTVAGRPIGGWQFESDERLEELIQLFNSGEAAIEPNAFHEMLTRTRRDMFQFLGIE